MTSLPLAALNATSKANVAVEPGAPSATLGDEIESAGASSSSAMVSVTAAGSDTPLSPDAAAVTVTDLSGPSVASSTAVTVTAPALAVDPAAMISVAGFDSVKSPETAFVPAAAVTVSVTASLDARSSAAVTVVTPPLSEIDEDDSFSVAVGVASSSVSVRLAPVTAMVCESAAAWPLDAAPVTVTVRLPTLSMASFTALIVAVSAALAVSPAAITIVASEPTV